MTKKKRTTASKRAARASLSRMPKSEYHTCSVCKREDDLPDDALEFFQDKAAGKEGTSFQRYYERYVLSHFPNPPSMAALRKHVIRCLRRDIQTGAPI